MKKNLVFILIFVLFVVFPMGVLASDILEQADALYNKGDLESMYASIPLYVQAVEEDPESYEANWKCARAHREYADYCLEHELEGWKDICKEYGKIALGYGEKAKELEPEKVEGHYYFGLSAATYSDGVSIIKAIKEGLKGDTEDAFYEAYDIDKMYDTGGPILAIGRFWHQLPFPFKKKKRAEKFLEEHHQYFPDDPEGLVYYAELLIDRKKKDEARPLLEKAIAGDEPYYSKWAAELLEDL